MKDEVSILQDEARIWKQNRGHAGTQHLTQTCGKEIS